jgi:hypothetical protein
MNFNFTIFDFLQAKLCSHLAAGFSSALATPLHPLRAAAPLF